MAEAQVARTTVATQMVEIRWGVSNALHSAAISQPAGKLDQLSNFATASGAARNVVSACPP
jgi:hypothetical protein